jgi:serine/threonine-protein kinase
MGEVYVGEQVSLGRKVAIKTLYPDLHTQPGMAERFKREAQLLSAVDHPAVVRVIDYGDTATGACLVMEYVEGESLFSAIQYGPLPVARALPLLHEIAEGLLAIHDKGIIHRDIKPENVLLTKSARGEQARLLDFGIARLVEPAMAGGLTQVGLIVGTPEYLSPEQAVGAAVDERSDLYSFGVLAYRVLSGRLPFPGPGPTQYVAQHASSQPLHLLEAAPPLLGHPVLVALVMQLLDKEPSRRPQRASELVDALATLRAALGPSRTRPPESPAPLEPAAGGSGTAPLGQASPAPAPAGTSVIIIEEEDGGGSGTVAFGPLPPEAPRTAPPVPTPRPAPSGSVPLPREPNSRSGPRPSGSRLSPASSLAARPQNLTVMRTALKDFTERTSRQTHEQNARMLETHDGLLVPLVRAHGGKLVHKHAGSLLATFPSPTGAVLCGMAMQDRLWRHNQGCAAEEQLHVRLSLHAGEVLVTRDAVLGEPGEVVKTVEPLAEPGDVTFTAAVDLARNRAEAEAEPCGTVALPGSGEPLQLYRCRRAMEGLPFGGKDEAPQRPARTGPPLVKRLRPLLWPMWAERTVARARRHPGRALGVGLAVAALLGGALFYEQHRRNPLVRAEGLLEEGKPAEALKLLAELPVEAQQAPVVKQVRAAVHHAKGEHSAEYTLLAGLAEPEREGVENRVLDGLAEDFGEDEVDKELRKLLSTLPKERVREHFAELAVQKHTLQQWGALRYLDMVQQDTRGLDVLRLYVQALESPNCAVRGRAARQLASLGDAAAVPALERLSQLPREKGSKSCGQDEAKEALQAFTKKKKAR